MVTTPGEPHRFDDEEDPSESNFFHSTLHGPCPTCYHFHRGVPIKIPLDQQIGHIRPECEVCGRQWGFGLGRTSTQITLASRESIPPSRINSGNYNHQPACLNTVVERDSLPSRSPSTSFTGRPLREPSGNVTAPGTGQVEGLAEGRDESPTEAGREHPPHTQGNDLLSQSGQPNKKSSVFNGLRGSLRKRWCGTPYQVGFKGYRLSLILDTPRTNSDRAVRNPSPSHGSNGGNQPIPAVSQSTTYERNRDAGLDAPPNEPATSAPDSTDTSNRDQGSPKFNYHDTSPSVEEERLRRIRRMKTIQRENMNKIRCDCTNCPCRRDEQTGSDIPSNGSRAMWRGTSSNSDGHRSTGSAVYLYDSYLGAQFPPNRSSSTVPSGSAGPDGQRQDNLRAATTFGSPGSSPRPEARRRRPDRRHTMPANAAAFDRRAQLMDFFRSADSAQRQDSTNEGGTPPLRRSDEQLRTANGGYPSSNEDEHFNHIESLDASSSNLPNGPVAQEHHAPNGVTTPPERLSSVSSWWSTPGSRNQNDTDNTEITPSSASRQSVAPDQHSNARRSQPPPAFNVHVRDE